MFKVMCSNSWWGHPNISSPHVSLLDIKLYLKLMNLLRAFWKLSMFYTLLLSQNTQPESSSDVLRSEKRWFSGVHNESDPPLSQHLNLHPAFSFELYKGKSPTFMTLGWLCEGETESKYLNFPLNFFCHFTCEPTTATPRMPSKKQKLVL